MTPDHNPSALRAAIVLLALLVPCALVPCTLAFASSESDDERRDHLIWTSPDGFAEALVITEHGSTDSRTRILLVSPDRERLEVDERVDFSTGRSSVRFLDLESGWFLERTQTIAMDLAPWADDPEGLVATMEEERPLVVDQVTTSDGFLFETERESEQSESPLVDLLAEALARDVPLETVPATVRRSLSFLADRFRAEAFGHRLPHADESLTALRRAKLLVEPAPEDADWSRQQADDFLTPQEPGRASYREILQLFEVNDERPAARGDGGG